ncbi:NADH:flavin oxidoreductase/NADH oxidase family protein [Lacticigenium naphthae]|uniref:NADH:flavin oxidoreductase/NADH oxidase family protein n=1 Tax=Lacticigenium naphthae TaxID=515351 RepID=UPI0004197208|nr:NADH:flavin oxidoreductase/NADH oxidase family protein [Lacticigenium naphthae]
MANLKIAEELTLPNGTKIKNRFCKSAMSEAMGNSQNGPESLYVNLYKKWAEGGSGLVVTGNVMIDRGALGEPGNVVIEDDRDLDSLKRWAKAGTINGTHLWMQINHPGKQSPKTLSKEPVAPSAIPLCNRQAAFFNKPRTLTNKEIKELINKFVNTAAIAKKAGFTGVQIHGAHGYLISQFLSPFDNRRNDEYGGPIENRMRFLVEIYLGMRRELGNDFPIGIKLNSSDFKEGGFSKQDSLKVVMKLAELGIDLIEISGGNYENPKMFSDAKENEEAFFIDYTRKLKNIVDTPLVVTGGFRSIETMERALENNETSMIGMARPLALNPDIPEDILTGHYVTVAEPRLTTGCKALDKKLGSLIGLTYYEQQIQRIAKGKNPRIHRNAWSPLLHNLKVYGRRGLSPRR